MGTPRTLAGKLLRAVVLLAPAESRDWANAMLRELDFIEGEWAALFWALGSATAIFRHAGRNWRKWFQKYTRGQEVVMNGMMKKIVGFVVGMLVALAFAFVAIGLVRLADYLSPAIAQAHIDWTHVLIAEIFAIVAATLLWRKRTSVSIGIMVFAIVGGAHVAIHYAMR